MRGSNLSRSQSPSPHPSPQRGEGAGRVCRANPASAISITITIAGGSHAAEPSRISGRSGRLGQRCARAAGVRAEISFGRADPADRAVRGRRAGRHPGAHHRRSARQAARPEHRDREPRRRRRQHRDRRGGAGAGRRLHAAAHVVVAGGQSAALQERAVRSLQGLRADLAARDLADADAGDAHRRAHAPEFIAKAKARPGQLNFATPGAGTKGHFAVELLKRAPASTSCTCRIRADRR